MSTATSPTVPAWLNLEALVPPELVDHIPRAAAAANRMLHAVAECFDELRDIGREFDAAVNALPVDDLPQLVGRLIGYDVIESRVAMAHSLLEHLADGEPFLEHWARVTLLGNIEIAHIDPEVRRVLVGREVVHCSGEAVDIEPAGEVLLCGSDEVAVREG